MDSLNPSRSRRWLLPAIAISLAMLANSLNADALRALGLNQLFAGFSPGWPLLLNILDLLAVVVCLRVIAGVSLARQWQIGGLARPVGAAALFAAILFVPAIAVLMMVAQPGADIDMADLVFGGLIFPMFEEIVFRGLAIGVLMSHFRWPFLPAALLPSLFFGAFHMWQGEGLQESLTIAGFTAFGGIWFGWISWKWGFNLWPAFFLHAGLNLLWTIFALGENALGGQVGNVIRVAVIVGSVVLTLYGQNWFEKITRTRRAAPAV